MHLSRRYLLIVIFFVLYVSAFAQRAVPAHGGVWVHDEANVLSPETVAQLEQILKAERDSTSNQIAILIVPSLEGEDIDGFGIRVADAWKAGNETKDNGVVFIVAIEDRKMRIETGLGLEGVLTDALASRINRNEVAPQFRQGNYDAGVLAGTVAIIQAIKGTYVNENPRQKGKRGGRSSWVLLVIIIIIVVMSRRKGGGGGMGGYWAASMAGSLLGGGGRSGSDFGGGGGFGGGGSSDSW